MSKLDDAYQRWDCKQAAIAAVTGEPFKRKRRFWEMSRNIEPLAYYWDKDKLQLGHVERIRRSMRLVGAVVPDARPSHQIFNQDPVHNPMGWYCNDHGECWKNGEGLVWGVVYLLSGKGKRCRAVAGYKVGGNDGVTLDLGTVFTSEITEDTTYRDDPEIRKCARHADHMAQEVAEKEREYQRQQREEEDEDDEAA